MTSPTSTTSPTDPRAVEIRAVLDAVYAAWAANDPDAFVTGYTVDATVSMPRSFAADRREIRDHMAAGFAGPLAGSRGIDEPQTIRFPTPDVCLITSLGGILMAGETSVPDERRVRATWVLVHGDDGWKIAAYSNCPAGQASI